MFLQSSHRITIAVLVGVLVLSSTSLAVAQETEAVPEAAQPPTGAEPGKHHQHLDRLAGNWDFTVKIWVLGQDDPVESSGTLSAVWILDGKFLKTELTSTFMGQPYVGLGLDGYDTAAGHYASVWVESTGTAIATFEGECEMAGKMRVMNTETRDPASGETVKVKGVTTVLNDNSYMYESFVVGSDGTEVKQFELVGKRRS